jgi:hypothetical protein
MDGKKRGVLPGQTSWLKYFVCGSLSVNKNVETCDSECQHHLTRQMMSKECSTNNITGLQKKYFIRKPWRKNNLWWSRRTRECTHESTLNWKLNEQGVCVCVCVQLVSCDVTCRLNKAAEVHTSFSLKISSEEGGSKFLRNVGKFIPDYTAAPRSTRVEMHYECSSCYTAPFSGPHEQMKPFDAI